MSKTTATPVTARTIRLAFAEGKFTAPDSALLSLTGHGPNGEGTGNVRGRLHPDAREAYLAAFPDHTYEPGEVKDEKTVTLPLTKPNARGARLKRPEDFTYSQVRALAGISGRKGRLSADHLAAAVAAVETQRGWR